MPLSGNMVRFFISYATAFAVFSFAAKWFLWPTIKDRAPKIALTPLLLYACLRVNGLMFLMPGLVSPNLPQAFATPTAYGDLAAACLALLALWPLRAENSLAAPMVWLFNIEGMLDLIYANVSTFKDHVDPTYLACRTISRPSMCLPRNPKTPRFRYSGTPERSSVHEGNRSVVKLSKL